LLRDVGFSLRESKALLASRTQGVEGWRRLAHRKLADLDEQIAKAQTAKEVITHGLACPHDDFTTCPNSASIVAARLAGQPLEEAHRTQSRDTREQRPRWTRPRGIAPPRP
jgi:DNA-binding transcriptional MerR regulator